MKTFNQRNEDFDVLNMTHLAFCSVLAYKHNDVVEAFVKAGGMGYKASVEFFGDPDTDTQGYVIHNDRAIIVAFRGTEGKATDWKTDLKAGRRKSKHFKGKIHKGFLRAFESVAVKIRRILACARTCDQPIWVTGHSLGGALAVLCAMYLGKYIMCDAMGNYLSHLTPVKGIYTFGQPRVGNGAFAKKMDAQFSTGYYRIINNNDVVPRVPPVWLGYRHAGQLKYFDTNGKLRHCVGSSYWSLFGDRIKGRCKGLTKFNFADGVSDHNAEGYLNLSKSLK